MSESGWRGVNEIPQAAGWYRVRREGEAKIRAYGQGHWWIPLIDGWLSADGVYEWEALPIAALGADEDRSPLDELAEVERIADTSAVVTSGG